MIRVKHLIDGKPVKTEFADGTPVVKIRKQIALIVAIEHCPDKSEQTPQDTDIPRQNSTT